jgi:ATP-binding cassette subfamily C protein
MQALASVREARLMAGDLVEVDAFSRHSQTLSDIRAKVTLVQSIPALAIEWLVFVGIAGVLGLLASNTDAIQPLVPTLAAGLYAASRLVPQVMSAVRQIARGQFMRASLEGAYDLVVAQPARPDMDRGGAVALRSQIVCRDVTVKYRGNVPALRGVTLTIPRGAHVGIAGPSGAGKTTLVNTLLGFLHPAAGEVTVDGVSIFEGLRSWQRRIGFVPQDTVLLDDTIAANITFGRHFPDEAARLRATLAAVQLDSFVASLAKGVDTVIGERGARIAGGQRQRIAMARALYGDPEVVVLDEATSALDPEVAAAIDDAIAALRGRKTLIVIAHRLASMRRCDFVVFMENGCISDLGRLEDLAARNAAFARFAGMRIPTVMPA